VFTKGILPKRSARRYQTGRSAPASGLQQSAFHFLPARAMDHPFDTACALTRAGSSRFSGAAPSAYWNMAGPFGGTTAATLLHAAMLEQGRAVEPVALTVNFCAALTPGAFSVTAREVRSGKSVRHVAVELQQGDTTMASASVVFAARRDTWAHQVARLPAVPPPDAVAPMDSQGRLAWLQRYEFRFVSGALRPQAQPYAAPEPAQSTLWVADVPRRPLDHLSLAALCDVFFVRVFQVRGTIVPAGTVTMTVHFHASAAEIAAQGPSPVLGVADANTFTRNFGDQTAQMWSRSGRLLATSTQLAWFKE
jgi:acyl-CoA thioesterase